MALIKCPECRREISSLTRACPYCGYPLNENSYNKIEIHNETCVELHITTSDNRNYYIEMNKVGFIEIYENGNWYFECAVPGVFFSDDIKYYGKYFVVKGKRVKIKVERKSEGFWNPIYYLQFTELE